MKPLGLYIHIPFCIKKCNYCDFLSLGNRNTEDHAAYIDALTVEMEYYKDEKLPVDSVYIGGGTPSLPDPDLILRVMEGVRNCFLLYKEAEITIETNPGLLDRNKLFSYRRVGINRLSIGAQSLSDEILSFLGRVHDSGTFLRNFDLARDCGFENISVDLIFAIPGQTKAAWEDSLEKIIALRPEHISFYGLQIEEGTPFFNLWAKGALERVPDETDRQMYHEAVSMLKAGGYHHYEISNAAKPGYESRHNLKYWSMDEYLGLGLGAHSYINGSRFSNETDLAEYVRISEKTAVGTVPTGGSPWATWHHQNTALDEMSEYLFTGLRKTDGIILSAFEERFEKQLTAVYENAVKKHTKTGLIELDRKEGRLRLTAKGLDLFNQVLVDFV